VLKVLQRAVVTLSDFHVNDGINGFGEMFEQMFEHLFAQGNKTVVVLPMREERAMDRKTATSYQQPARARVRARDLAQRAQRTQRTQSARRRMLPFVVSGVRR
jgi:hypothetical protein